MKAAQHQRLLAASLAITRALLLLAVMLLWPENRVWAFAPAPHLASAETSHATPSSIRGNVPLAADPASGCCVAAEGTAEGTTTLFRAVSPEEYSSVMDTGQFSFGPEGSEMKQFGFNLNETYNFANFQPDYAAIIQADIPTSALGNFSVSNQIDPFIFRSGVLTVNGQSGLDLFNSFVTNIGPAP